jgi:fermentation-respiration switch protein FrsA (DUF1100 family)
VEWKKSFVQAMDDSPPPPTPFPTVEELRTKIQEQQLLFVTGENDAFVPAEAYERALKKFRVEGHTRVVHLPGGHNAIFLEKGHEAFKEWAGSL